MQRALIQYRNPKNYDLVYEALEIAGRSDLIGFDKKCLIRPKKYQKENVYAGIKRTQTKETGKKTKKKTIRNVHKKK